MKIEIKNYTELDLLTKEQLINDIMYLQIHLANEMLEHTRAFQAYGATYEDYLKLKSENELNKVRNLIREVDNK